ncbi:hypothetical protein ACH32B_23550 [Enterobacter dykesii]
MSKNSESFSEKVRQENLLMFCGMAFMAAGPVFWYLAGLALDARALNLGPGTTGILDWIIIAISLLLSLCGAALCLAGWSLSAWHAWRAVSQTGGVR